MATKRLGHRQYDGTVTEARFPQLMQSLVGLARSRLSGALEYSKPPSNAY
ncbi:hypothetical protein BN2476_1550002 [Paraburkholderia piptadeniae]|uniref:Uncharacterized protein n=1 Tax=Paraburkholderia piptadeniae TaxID=1701573 RepID=A0A1N7SYA8_9BURK|nr:hypothetical protein BN2476_1550002 [Paraburkholderia piptadeniae]